MAPRTLAPTEAMSASASTTTPRRLPSMPPGAQQDHDYRRLRQLERAAAVEGRVTAAGRRDGPDPSGLPLSARHLEMKQDRTPHVLSYQPELAGRATDQPADGSRTDHQHPHQS